MKDLAVYILTWNCGREFINPSIFSQHLFSSWDPSSTTKQATSSPATTTTALPDVLVVNLQEIAPISYAFLGSTWTKAYFDRFRTAVDLGVRHHMRHGHNDDDDDEQQQQQTVHYFNVVSRNSGLTGIMVFVRDELVHCVKDLQVADVGVGWDNMGNKGAVGVRLGWDAKSGESDRSGREGNLMYMTFVSAHLAPFEEEIERRNEDYRQIVANLVFTGEEEGSQKMQKSTRNEEGQVGEEENTPMLSSSSTLQDLKTMYSNDSHLFFSGDLNYRTGLTKPSPDDFKLFPQPCKDAKDPKHYSHLLEKDQLAMQHDAGKVLQGLTEQRIDFPPTYKYKGHEKQDVWLDEDLDEWNWAEHRWPSWCDRICYSTNGEPKIVAGKYMSLPLFGTSDHRPVGLSASIPVAPVTGSELADEAPVEVNKDWRSRKDIARRKELAVGIMSYLGLTWPGNSMLIATAMFVVGGLWYSNGSV